MNRRVHASAGLALALCMALTGCDRGADGNTIAAADTAKEAEAIHQQEAALLQQYGSKNVDGALAVYADDAMLMFPGAPHVQDRKAAGDMLRAMTSDPAFKLTFETKQTLVSAAGDLAYTRGTFSNTYTDPATKKPATMIGSFLTVFRKQVDGSWKIIEDIATPTVPAA